jgi:phage terminase large subunit-like protein
MTFTETLAAIESMAARWPRAITKLIEAKANGPAIVDALTGRLSGLTPVEPQGGKEARAHAVAPLFAAGNVLLPHPERAEYPDGRRGAPWLRGGVVDLSRDAAEGSFEASLIGFPRARHDDDVDAATQALNHRAGSFVSRLRAAFGPQKDRP